MNFRDAWILMWGLAYVACGFSNPDIVGNFTLATSMMFLFFMGFLLLIGFALMEISTITMYKTLGRILLLIAGVMETIGGVVSWTGVIVWNVPFADKALFNVSMAIFDLVSASFLFEKSLSK